MFTTTRQKNHQPAAMLLRTRLNNVVLPTLFKVVDNIVTPNSGSTILFNVVDNYEQNVGSTTLFNAVILQAHNFWPWIM